MRFAHLEQLFADHLVDQRLFAEQRAQLFDLFGQVVELGLDLVGLHRGESLEPQVQDRLSLFARELELGHQAFAGCVRVGRRANECDDFVDVADGDQKTGEDVGARLRLAQAVLRAAGDDLFLVREVVRERGLQRKRLRHAVNQRDGVDTESLLHRRVLEELVLDDVGDDVALELDHEAHAVAVGLVTQVGDLWDLLVTRKRGDLGDQAVLAALTHHVRKFCDDQSLFALLDRFDVADRLHAHAAAAGLERFTNT